MTMHQRIPMLMLVVVGVILAVAGSACGGGDNPTAEPSKPDFASIVRTVQDSSPATTNKESSAKPTSVATATKSDSSTTASQPTTAPTTKPAPTKAAPPPPAKPDTVNGLPNRGPGPFNPGEAVIGYEIVMNGLKYRQCYMPSATAGGTVNDGKVNPFWGEVIYSECGQGVEDPDTVNGRARRGPGSFSVGEAVTGYEITIGGSTYRQCYFASAPGNGSVSDGVVNPYPGEVLSPCGNPIPVATPVPARPDTVNGLPRKDGCTPSSPCSFAAGQPITGFFTINGKKYDNCYMANPPAAGVVTDGVINPWKNEVADDRVC